MDCGEKGCSKTILLRTICGLIVPKEGKIRINDKILHRDMGIPESIGALIENPAFMGEYSDRGICVPLSKTRVGWWLAKCVCYVSLLYQSPFARELYNVEQKRCCGYRFGYLYVNRNSAVLDYYFYSCHVGNYIY